MTIEGGYEKGYVPVMDSWDALRSDLMKQLDSAGMAREESVSFLVAAEEIFANIVMYAFPEGYKNDDICRIGFDTGTVNGKKAAIIIFTDSGTAFDPTIVPRREAIISSKGLLPGGFGITMAKEKTDEMLFKRENGCNILTLIKYIR